MASPNVFYLPETVRPENSVGYLINRVAQSLARELDHRMGSVDLTDAQWKPLLLLQQGVCLTAADIARLGCHDTGAVTRMLDRLEAKGLIRRIRSESDRRVINLQLTEEGSQISSEVPKILSHLLNQALADFSKEEFDLLTRLLERVLANLQSVNKGSEQS